MRLLVIEDERDLCEDIAKKLRLSGYEADTCVDGEAALELLAVERYDLVLLDLNLPKVDGMTVLRTLREHDQETGAKMHLPFHGGNAAPENYIEGLLWSELGDYVREILRKERE